MEQHTEHHYGPDPRELSLTKTNFWFYVISFPIIIFLLFVLPILRGIEFQLSIFTIGYIALILVLLYLTYRSYRVMAALKRTSCTVTEETVSGVSTPNPNRGSESFSIRKDEILGIGKKQINFSMYRYFFAVVLNTKDKQYVLLGVERADELIREIRGE